MTIPKLSVLMPVHNGELHLGQTVTSILVQTFTNFELIVIDDGSTDDTFDLLANFAKQDSRIQLLRNETNLGIVRTMDKLFRLARGTYINRHDSDDISMPDRYERQIAFLDANAQIGMVTSQVEIIDAQGASLNLDMYSGPTDNEGIQQELLVRCPICQTSVMFRRDLLGITGLYDALLEPAEDYDLWLRMAEVSKIARLPDSLCQYRYHSQSISHRRSGTQFCHTAEALEKAAARRFGTNAPMSLRKCIALYYAWSAERFCKSDDFEQARECLIRSLLHCPEIFVSGSVLLPIPDMQTRIEFAKSLFRKLPHLPGKTQIQRRFLANLRMKEVFDAVGQGVTDPIDRNLWLALWGDPRWLLNRGVISIVIRSILRGLRYNTTSHVSI